MGYPEPDQNWADFQKTELEIDFIFRIDSQFYLCMEPEVLHKNKEQPNIKIYGSPYVYLSKRGMVGNH